MAHRTRWSIGIFTAMLALGAAHARAEDPAPPQAPPAEGEPPPPDEAPAAPAPPQIALEPSFELEQKEGKAITHVPAVVYTTDGQRLVMATSNGEVVVWKASDRSVISRAEFAGEVEALAVDDAGRVLVALLKSGELKVIDPATGKVRVEGKIEGGTENAPNAGAMGKAPQVGHLSIAHDGKTLVLARGDILEVRTLPELKLRAHRKTDHGFIQGLDVSRDGVHAATVGSEGGVAVWKTDDLVMQWTRKRPQPLFAVAFSPDGTRVAFGGQQNIVWERAVAAEGDEVVLAEGQPYWITTLGYSPDGGTLAIGDESCDIWLLDVQAKKHLFHGKHHVECWLSQVAWTPDSESFTFGCRPNAHAGQPSVWQGNVHAEALLDETVQAKARAQGAAMKQLVRCYESADPKLAASLRDLIVRRAHLNGQPLDDAAIEQISQALLAGAAHGAMPSYHDASSAIVQSAAAENTIVTKNGQQAMPIKDMGALALGDVIVDQTGVAGVPIWGGLSWNGYSPAGAGYQATLPQAAATEGSLSLQSIEMAKRVVLGVPSTEGSLNGFVGTSLAVTFQLAHAAALKEIDAKLEEARKAILATKEAQEVLERYQVLDGERREAFDKRCAEIEGRFAVNQWNVKRK